MIDKQTLNLQCPKCQADMGTLGEFSPDCPCGFVVETVRTVPLLRVNNEEEIVDYIDSGNGLSEYSSEDIAIPFVQEALDSGNLVLEIGAGRDNCDRPNLVRTDAYIYSKELDICADVHSLPFSDNSFDFVYSLAVFEHLHTPWVAAEEIYRVLKPGGKVYVLCAFNQHIHGYPSHFFNMTDMGLKRIFNSFKDVTSNPSPYCPLDQISVSLLDLGEMNAIQHSEAPEHDTFALQNSISTICDVMNRLGPKLIDNKKTHDYWHKIAPGFDLYATK